jgi:serine/threonine-protein kinase RsbW
MHATTKDRPREVKIPSDPAVARLLQDEIEQALHQGRFTERDIFCVRLALEEALVNAMKHGNQADRTKHVHITYRVDADLFEVDIRDEGPGFDQEEVPDPLAVENLERPCGRGLLLMRHYMTEVKFHPPGNRVFMTKVASQESCNGYA